MGKGISHQTDDDGRVVKDMGEQDGAQRPDERDRSGLQVEKSHQAKVDPAVRSKQGIETGRDDHGRHHEGDGGQGPQRGLAGEIKAGKHECDRQTQREGQQGGEDGLVKSETENAGCQQERAWEEGKKRGGVKAYPQDAGKRVEKEQAEEDRDTQPWKNRPDPG